MKYNKYKVNSYMKFYKYKVACIKCYWIPGIYALVCGNIYNKLIKLKKLNKKLISTLS